MFFFFPAVIKRFRLFNKNKNNLPFFYAKKILFFIYCEPKTKKYKQIKLTLTYLKNFAFKIKKLNRFFLQK